MNKDDKKAQVEEFHDKFSRAEAAFLADFSGISVEEMTQLRRSLRDASVEFKILRNTLAKRALEGTPYAQLGSHFTGPTAVALSFSDAATAAKALVQFAKDQPKLEIKVGALGEKLLELSAVKGLAELPTRDELLAKLLGVFSNVPGGLVGVLAGVPRKFVYALGAIQRTKQG